MATGTYMPWVPQFFNDNGDPLAAGTVETFVAGTATHAAVYTDVNLSVAYANPFTLLATGRPASFTVFLVPGQSYDFVIKDSGGATVDTLLNMAAVPTASGDLDVTGTAGETLLAGKPVYESDGSGGKTQGLWYLTDATNTYSATTPLVGIVPSTIASGASGTIRIGGRVTGLSSLTVGANYFLAASSGALTSTAPTNRRFVGQADSTSSLILAPSPSLTQLVGTMTTGQIIVGSTGNAPQVASITTVATSVLDRQVTLQTVVNSAAETAVYTYAVPANTLSTNRTIRLSLIGDHLNNTGGTVGLTVRVKYGATTIFSGTVAAINNGANRGSLQLDLELTAANATNAQRAKGFLQYGDSSQNNAAGVAGNLTSVNTYTLYAVHNAIAEDSTASKNLVITYQTDTANASNDMRAHTVYAELK